MLKSAKGPGPAQHAIQQCASRKLAIIVAGGLMTMSNLKHKPGAGRASSREAPTRAAPGHVAGITAILLACWLGAALAAALPQAPPQIDPATLPARDVHQGMLIAADPYTDEARSKAKFGKKNPVDSGILALEVYLRNDT